MNEADAKTRINDLSSKVDLLIFSYRVGTLAVLFFISFVNVADTFAITWFRNVYRNDLPGKPLPPFTEFLLHFQALVGGFAVLCPVVGTVTTLAIKNIAAAIGTTTCVIILIVFQIILTWFFLFLPMLD